MADTKLTDKQQSFVDFLFGAMHEGAAFGPSLFAEASEHAGYKDHWSHVFNSTAVKEALYDNYKKHAAVYGLEAFAAIVDVARDPCDKQKRLKLQAAQALLDASAIPYKQQEQTQETPTGVIVLPSKKKVIINVEEVEDGEE